VGRRAGIDVRFLIHDHDTKFTEAFDEHLAREDGGPVHDLRVMRSIKAKNACLGVSSVCVGSAAE
jgi:hypothetical protein